MRIEISKRIQKQDIKFSFEIKNQKLHILSHKFSIL